MYAHCDPHQPTEIGLGSSSTDSSLLKLTYDYGTTSNNGNVLRQIITVPTIGSMTGFTATQHYQYDQLNRLTGSQEVNGTSSTWQSSGTLWQQKFSYDRFGNRSVDTANTTTSMIGPNPNVSATTNRIVSRSSPVEYYRYDDAGNLDREKNNETLAYDAENEMVQYQGGVAQTGGADYSYDGDGRRVKKTTNSETLTFVYNIAGQLVAEYTTSTPQNNGTSYLTSDTLGTPRVNTKSDGSVRARHDYLPFGEELYGGVGNRTDNTGQGYDQALSPADSTRQKFTSKESIDPKKTAGNLFLLNLNNASTQYKNLQDKNRPPNGVDDQIGINFAAIDKYGVSDDKTLKKPLHWTITFHELAEAYAKVHNSLGYEDAHKEAVGRETRLREQRPYLKEYVPGAGPGMRIRIR